MIDVMIDTKEGIIVTRSAIRAHGIRVPSGFMCDGASVPAIAKPIFNNGVRYLRAAIIHDYCYRTGKVPRIEADAVFKKVLREDGVTPLKAYLMWLGVRSFGWQFYKKCET
jgi:hypothetical protein